MALVRAAPVIGRDSVGVTSAELTAFELYSQYAAAAYCYEDVTASGQAVSCSAEGGTCPIVTATGATVIKNMYNVGLSMTSGYVALDTVNEVIVASFQGTSDDWDFLDDADIVRETTDLCGTANTHDGCLVHDGFYACATDTYTDVLDSIETALAANPTYKIVTTGHSLGGAISALMATMLRNAGYVVDMYSYGQPRLGSVDISLYISNQAPALGNNYRITHFDDEVPQLPPHIPEDDPWDHLAPEYWITVNGTFTTPVTTSQIDIITESLFTTNGNSGTDGEVSGHYNYFGPISACDSSKPSS